MHHTVCCDMFIFKGYLTIRADHETLHKPDNSSRLQAYS